MMMQRCDVNNLRWYWIMLQLIFRHGRIFKMQSASLDLNFTEMCMHYFKVSKLLVC